MEYWRIRKEWNDGKWDKTQVGAYSSYESALKDYKEEYKKEGYKIFSPTGDILYPHHDIVQMMLDDGVDIDESYWDNIFINDKIANNIYIQEIICKYSRLLNDKCAKTEIITHNDINIYKIPLSVFN